LCDLFGNKIEEVLSKIKLIYISHLHGDHFFGIFNMLYQINKTLNKY